MAFKDEVGSLDRIATACEEISGGNVLPKPTVADEGKVVTVGSDGKYELGECGGSGGGVVVPEYRPGKVGGPPVECDMTFSEIWSAIEDGKCNRCKYTAMTGALFYNLSYITDGVILWGIAFMDPSGEETVSGFIAHSSAEEIRAHTPF